MSTTPSNVALQERRLGRAVLNTYRSTVDLYDVLPNDQQPRMGPKIDLELQRQIEANEGLFEPLLVEPHPEHPGKFRISPASVQPMYQPSVLATTDAATLEVK